MPSSLHGQTRPVRRECGASFVALMVARAAREQRVQPTTPTHLLFYYTGYACLYLLVHIPVCTCTGCTCVTYLVQGTLYIPVGTSYIVQNYTTCMCASSHHTLDRTLFTMYYVHRTMYIVYIVHSTSYHVQGTMYICTLYTGTLIATYL